MGTRLVFDDKERLLTWAQAQIGNDGFRPEATAIGYEVDGQLHAVAVYEAFTKYDCDIHVAVIDNGRHLTRGVLAAVFSYPFVQLGLLRITGRVLDDNPKALSFDHKLGFVTEGHHPNAAGPGKGIYALGMLRNSCRFLPKQGE